MVNQTLLKRLLVSRVILLIAVLLGICFYDIRLGGTVFWSYWHSETSIARWMARGWTPFEATFVATLLGNLSDINWWLLVFYDAEVWQPMRKAVHSLWSFDPKPIHVSWKYLLLRYAAVPIVCIMPNGGVLVSLIAAKFLRLNKWITLALVLVGNTLKNTVWGKAFALLATKFSMKTVEYIALASLILAIVLAAWKLARKIRGVVTPAIQPESGD